MLSKDYIKKIQNFVQDDEAVRSRIIKQLIHDWNNMREILDAAKEGTGVNSSFGELREALLKLKDKREGK